MPEEGEGGTYSPCHFYGGERGKKRPTQVHFLLYRHSYLIPHMFSQFEEMHINTAFTVEEGDKILKILPFANLQIFNFN